MSQSLTQSLYLTGTAFSSCILYLSKAFGLPVKSRKAKKLFIITNTANPCNTEPAIKQSTNYEINIFTTELLTQLPVYHRCAC